MHLLFASIALTALSCLQLCGASLSTSLPKPPCRTITTLDVDGRHEFNYSRLYFLQDRFWHTFTYEAEREAQSIKSHLLSPNIQGRVDITRKFSGQELNTEYLFGLFANVKTEAANNSVNLSLFGYPTEYHIQSFTANRDIASASTIVNFTNSLLGSFPIEILTWIQFDKDGLIAEYDATYRFFAPLLETTLRAVLPRINGTSLKDAVKYFRNTVASAICSTHDRHCTGKNRQYDSNFACRAFLINDVRFGEAWELGRNTLLCRSLHQNMVAFRPELHCPHIGPSGGDMCVDDLAYAAVVAEKVYDTPFLPWDASSSQCRWE
ncbi:hypothetical protein IWX90DRAFT_428600 [Phyllosticta citrichinensis]|uniref:Secreted protein n=1 Tax=Phyllosticta citrichinensis TaxID=1130410 RepID=A0ABR1Y0B8_9PEZI